MATARVSHKRNYDDFIAPYAPFGYSAHAGRNVEATGPEKMDVMEEVIPANKRSKFAFHDEEAAQISTPSMQARLAAMAIDTFPKLASTEDLLSPTIWLKALPRGRRRHHELIGTVGCIGRNESVFSLEDVTNILTASLKAQEERLHHQYVSTMQQKLEEVAQEYEMERQADIRSKQTQQEMSYFS